jgi:hypothetical protein
LRSHASIVETHARRFFRDHAAHFHDAAGPVTQRLPGFRVMVIEPGPTTEFWTYLTIGAHLVRHADQANEFLLSAPAVHDAHVELLAMVAHYHASPRAEDRLGVGHTVPIGRPWLPDSACDHLLVSLPYPFGRKLEQCEDVHGQIQILWLLPITRAERDFKIAHGLEALEQRFESGGLHYWDPRRASLI